VRAQARRFLDTRPIAVHGEHFARHSWEQVVRQPQFTDEPQLLVNDPKSEQLWPSHMSTCPQS